MYNTISMELMQEFHKLDTHALGGEHADIFLVTYGGCDRECNACFVTFGFFICFSYIYFHSG